MSRAIDSLFGLVLLLCLTANSAATEAGVVLKVVGEVPHPLSLTAEALAAMPHSSVTVKDRNGKETSYAGVPVRVLLDKAGIPSTKEMRNGAIALALVVEATDGYRAVFSLTEIDAQPADRAVLLADTRDGKPLSSPESPLRLIVPGDGRPTRWVRQVTTLRIAKP
jgi:DMSO/TMAO reductase YedYZ molybdopterin-dependent catalytic subunit